MIILSGKSVFGGIATGKIFFYKSNEIRITRTSVDDAAKETERFERAKIKAAAQLQSLFYQAIECVRKTDAGIFDVHRMILEDPEYTKSVINIIETQEASAEYAVKVTAEHLADKFAAMDDPYIRERTADIKDVSKRLLCILSDKEEHVVRTEEPVIFAAKDLSPSGLLRLDKSNILSLILMEGSKYSHTAILAKTMKLPTIVGIGEGLKTEYSGKFATVDGQEGMLYIEPDIGTMEMLQKKQREESEKRLLQEPIRKKEALTKGGRRVGIFANAGSLSDVEDALENGAQGIGLFRSEFLYLGRDTFPTEEEQFCVYRQAAEIMGSKKVVIRTFDIGADKQVGYFGLGREDNPALGCRAIRICLTRRELFKTQLRAIYRASAYGQVALLFPMIISIQEVKQIKVILEEVKLELRKEGRDFRENLEIGIMIETPAAVMISRELAKEVDFFSIGTNDLTQYTLAVDRQNQSIESLYDQRHPAVLAMIQMAVESAHAEGKRVTVCGELAEDLSFTQKLLELGTDGFSVLPGAVPPLRKKICECE